VSASSPVLTYVIGFVSVVVVIIFLSMMGLNIFVYLAKGTDSVDNFLTELAGTVSLKLGDNAGDIFHEFSKTFVFGADAALGASAAVEASAALVGVGSHMMSAGSGGSATPQKKQSQQSSSSASSSSAASANASAPSGNTASSSMKNSSTTSMAFSSQAASSSSPPASTASSSSSASASASSNINDSNGGVNPDDAASKLQTSKGSAKVQNWCFAGEDRGARTCVAVNDDQDCISGDIFPRQDICINPSLRV